MSTTTTFKTQTITSWAIYSNETGDIMFLGNSRSQAREWKRNYSGSHNLSGVRRVSSTVKDNA